MGSYLKGVWMMVDRGVWMMVDRCVCMMVVLGGGCSGMTGEIT